MHVFLEMLACICGNQSAEEASSLPNREGGACATVVDCGLCPEKCI